MSHGATILRYKFNKCDHKKPIQNTLRAYINPRLRKEKVGAGGKGLQRAGFAYELRHITNASRAAAAAAAAGPQ